jgi:glyoxylase-like metal-dependent hydrolase (beta-lactamase superfamily II)
MNRKSLGFRRTFVKEPIRSSILILAAMSLFLGAAAAETRERPFRVKKLSVRIATFQEGLYGNDSCLTVVRTDQGLIVVDTGLTSFFAEQMKRKFREVLGRDDVRYVINTHSHWDHTGGNQAFPEAEIIGHQNVIPAMRRFDERKDRFLADRRDYITRMERDLASKEPDSSEGRVLAERLAGEKAFAENLRTVYVSMPPTKTFSDRMTIRFADLTIKLFYYSDCFSPGPNRHTDNDILVQIPELKALLGGDAFFFYEKDLAPIPPPDDLSRWLDLMGEIIAEPVGIVSDGHASPLLGNGEMLSALYRYMKELNEAAIHSQKKGMDVQTFREQNTLAQKFAYLRKFYDFSSQTILDQHRANLESYLRRPQK